MPTTLDRIATKARQDKKFRFTSLAHHIDKALLSESLKKIKRASSPGIDGQDVKAAEESFATWAPVQIEAMHQRSYRPPPAKRVYIPKPGKSALRPIAMPTIQDKALQRATAEVLNSIYESDFLNVSFGGRPKRSAHQAVATMRQSIMTQKISWVYEADLKNFFGSLNHGWVEQFLLHRVGDPRLIMLIKRWLKAGVMEDGKHIKLNEGTAQGGPISVLISNIYLHYVLDLWIEKIVKPQMRGEVTYIRYLDDFVLCFQYQSDAHRFMNVVEKRLAKFSLALEPSKTSLVKFGRFAKGNSSQHSKATKPKTLYFLGFTFYVVKNRKGGFKVGMRTEKSRLKRSCAKITERLKVIRHLPIKVQSRQINQVLRGHYQYYGVPDNWDCINRFHYHVVKDWRKWLSTRSQNGRVSWLRYRKILKLFPLQEPKIRISYSQLRNLSML